MKHSSQTGQSEDKSFANRDRPNLTSLIFGALVLGIFLGVFFGQEMAPLKYIGDAYVGLLQMTVLPYSDLHKDGLAPPLSRYGPQFINRR